MRSEAMGKTLAIFLVMAMIATGIVLLPDSTSATGAYTVTGQLKDDVTDANVGGVKVTITNATLDVDKNVTSQADGKFSITVETRGDYTLTFEKSDYRTRPLDLLNETFNETTKKADVGIQLLEPLPMVSGTVKELGTTNVINEVEVTMKESASGNVIEQVMTVNGAFSVPVDTLSVNIYFKKDGYYDNNRENVAVAEYGVTNVGDVYLEKIVPTPTIKVWGIVFEAGTDNTLTGAVVSISAGDEKWITAVSDDVGYYEMLAYPGNFQMKGSLTGYKGTAAEWFNVPADKSVRKDLMLDKTPPETSTISGIIYETDGTTPINGADIYLHSIDGKYTNHTTSNGAGEYGMNFYPDATFVLEVRMDNYFTNASRNNIDATTPNAHVRLKQIEKVHKLSGIVYDAESQRPLENVAVTIHSKEYLYTQRTTTITNGYYEFMVHDESNFAMAVNKEGYQSKIINADNIDGNRRIEVGLQPSGSDIVRNTYTFHDWNTITVTRNSIISVDNVSVRANAERKYGMGPVGLAMNDGILSQTEIDAWAQDLEQKGAERRDTKGFLTLNDTYYLLNITSYQVTIEGANGSVAQDATIYINSTYNYTLVGELDNPDSDMFTLVFNATYDTEFLDNVYEIILPYHPDEPNNPMFEMTDYTTETPMVEVTGHNSPITIDPLVHDGDMETVTMTLERSLNGTATARVVDGLYYIKNSTAENYEVIVRQGGPGTPDTNVTFSARDSTDPVGDINEANFTWDFGDEPVHGIEVTHDFIDASGLVEVGLKITEAGGNVTELEHKLKIYVDTQDPVAGISADITDSGNMTFNSTSNTLTVNENIPITFSGVMFTDAEGMDEREIAGVASYDLISDGTEGIIDKWYWSWGEEDTFDETVTQEGSNNITHTYSNPGTYVLNLTVTDVVGRESGNTTWIVEVLDTTPPMADFQMKDADGNVVTEVIENKEYQYDASLTTDNLDDVENLTFEWFFEVGDTTIEYGERVINHTFDEVGTFNVTLRATDKAGNSENRTSVVHVNLGSRPNILMRLGTLVFDPSPGTAGKPMTISVNITNDGQENATDIVTTFYIRNPDGTDTVIDTDTTDFLGIGETATPSVTWTPNKKGEYTIWANASCPGEHSSQWWDNKIDDFSVQRVTVSEAGWVLPAIIVSIVVVIVLVFFGMKYFMKTGTKEEDFGDKRKKR